MSLNTVKILGVSVTSTEPVEVLSEIIDFVAKPTLVTPLLVFTPNPEFLVEASRDSEFRELLNKADINLPDGVGLIWASRLLGTPIKERISGADLVERLLEVGNGKWEVGREVRVGGGSGENKKWVVGIAGARRGVKDEAEELIKKLKEEYSNVHFVNLDDFDNCHSDRSHAKRDEVEESLSYILRGKGIPRLEPALSAVEWARDDITFDIVFTCHGMKEQEEWIWENENKTGKDKIKANVFMGVGGSLDFIAGFSRRAPMWMRQIGLEWLWRGLQKPTHFKRIWKAVFVFGWLVVKEKFVSARSLLAG